MAELAPLAGKVRAVASRVRRHLGGLTIRKPEEAAVLQLRKRIAAIAPAAGTVGFAMPDLAECRMLSLGNGNGILLALGASAGEALAGDFRFDSGATGNIIVLGRNAAMPRRLHFQARGGIALLAGENPWPVDIDARFSSDDNLLLVGRGATSNGTAIIIEGGGRSILLGDDCMFAARTLIRTSDLHAISTIDGAEWLNPPADVVVEPHVWLGEEVLIQKGVRVGAGAIVGARAVVTRDVPASALALGIPARVVRSGLRWQRSRAPEPGAFPEIDALVGVCPGGAG